MNDSLTGTKDKSTPRTDSLFVNTGTPEKPGQRIITVYSYNNRGSLILFEGAALQLCI